ncbi:MAG: FAD-dependent tricarballylate dehydrogenase TcuA [Desulfobacterales bacterium]
MSREDLAVGHSCDVLVIGGGNAALCAAMTAREAGARVTLLESAPKAFRGGNSRHTRNLRFLHRKPTPYLQGSYLEEEFWDDLMLVTGGKTNEALARLVIRDSEDVGSWMEVHGAKFQPPLRGTLHLARTNAHFLGGGKALVNAYYATAERLGVEIRYGAEAVDLEIEDGRFRSALVREPEGERRIPAAACVCAAGGFQADLAWLKEIWGEAAERFVIRGSPYDTGRVLRSLLGRGAKAVGDPRQCHAVAVDGRAPRFDGGIVTRLDCIPFGIVVNREGKRFYDEGENFWPKRYAIWGRLVAGQPGQEAFCLIDAKALALFMPSVFPPLEGKTIGELAGRLGLPVRAVEETVEAYNRAVRPGTFDPASLDDCRTEGLAPPKSHWARPLDTPPFYGYPLRPGITFTYLGVAVDETARVLREDGGACENLFAAGEIMSGNILGQGYMAGFGMTIGTVFGRIAGREAARHARG